MDYMSHCCLSLVFDIGQQSILTKIKIYIIDRKTQIFQEKIYLDDDKTIKQLQSTRAVQNQQ